MRPYAKAISLHLYSICLRPKRPHHKHDIKAEPTNLSRNCKQECHPSSAFRPSHHRTVQRLPNEWLLCLSRYPFRFGAPAGIRGASIGDVVTKDSFSQHHHGLPIHAAAVEKYLILYRGRKHTAINIQMTNITHTHPFTVSSSRRLRSINRMYPP